MWMSLADMYKSAFFNYSDQICVIEGEKEFTYKEIEHRVGKLVSVFASFRLSHADRIAILSKNRKECIELDAAVRCLC